MKAYFPQIQLMVSLARKLKIKQFTYLFLWKTCIRRDPNIKISHYHHVFL